MLELDKDRTLCPQDVEALRDIVTSILRSDLLIAEVGSWKGHSASIICGVIKEQDGRLYCIDHWEGDGCSGFNVEARSKDVFAVFKSNMAELELWDFVYPMYMDSVSASKVFADNILDMVFTDADHSYERVKEDITSWYSKVKIGGIMCGHDWDNPAHPGGHRGVTQAVEELLGNDYEVMGNCTWKHVKRWRKDRGWQQ